MKHHAKQTPLRRLTTLRPNGSVLLFFAAMMAIIFANSGLNGGYQEFLAQEVSVRLGEYSFFMHDGHNMTLIQFVNDALMAIFFFLVGLEIKQELLVGELSSPKQALLPVVAALGGMVMPVLAFLAIASNHPESLGAAIPMATDIAFALAVLGALGKKVPHSLKIFLTALAVVDDIGGIIVIAVFYSTHFSILPLLAALLLLLVIFLGGKLGFYNHAFYYVFGFAVWMLFLESGVHATIAGVLLAFAVPARPKLHLLDLPEELASLVKKLPKGGHRSRAKALVLSEHQVEVINTIQHESGRAISPLQSIEGELSPFVNFFVLPLFAFVNSGVSFGDVNMDSLTGVPLAICCGLVLGKTVGIFGFTWLCIRTKLCQVPAGMTMRNLFGVSILGGIGFTVSLFIANLSYGANGFYDLLNQAKIGIFAGTFMAGLLGYFVLNAILKKEQQEAAKWREIN